MSYELAHGDMQGIPFQDLSACQPQRSTAIVISASPACGLRGGLMQRFMDPGGIDKLGGEGASVRLSPVEMTGDRAWMSGRVISEASEHPGGWPMTVQTRTSRPTVFARGRCELCEEHACRPTRNLLDLPPQLSVIQRPLAGQDRRSSSFRQQSLVCACCP